MTVAPQIEAHFDVAIERRRGLIEARHTDAYRLINGAADNIAGLVVERLGPLLIVQFHEGRLDLSPQLVQPAIEKLLHRFGLSAAYAKYFVKDRSRLTSEQEAAHTRDRPWIGKPVDPRVTIHEYDAKFIIRPYDGFSYGLFLEHRDNRRRMSEWARGRRVLNLFCYTCGFSVTAGRGGAAEVTSVDVSKRYLDWGKSNLELNGIDPAKHRFICDDALEYYGRAQRQGRRYDLIVLDPPTFARQRRPARTFVLEKEIGALLRGAMDLLDPGGLLFFSTNNRNMNHGRIEREIRRAAGRRKTKIVERPKLPIDFSGDLDYSHSFLVQMD